MSTPADVMLFDPTTGLGLDPNSVAAPTYLTDQQLGTTTTSGAWSGLDNLGSSIANVASNLLSSAGNLVSAQVNQTALLTATGRRGAANTKAPIKNANSWMVYVAVIVGLVAVGGVIYMARK